MVGGDDRFESRFSVMVARTVVEIRGDEIPVKLLNPTEEGVHCTYACASCCW